MSGDPLPLEARADLPAQPPEQARIYLRPLALQGGGAARRLLDQSDLAIPIGGTGLAATAVEILVRETDRIACFVTGVAGLRDWIAQSQPARRARLARLLDMLTARPASLLPRPRGEARSLVMGVVNVTPDSFSDGGDFATPDAAIAKGRAMIAEGADLLDIGGESTRPGARPVDPGEEAARVLPVIEALAGDGVPISIDTRNASTMHWAIAAGARLVNDVSALTHDPHAIRTVADSGVGVVLMHSQSDPQTMQRDPTYGFAPLDVFDALEERIEACVAHGIGRDRIIVDPGIGFGKTIHHNLAILERLALFHGLGCPILLGVSRKSFIGKLSRGEAPKERGPGSLAAALDGIAQGAGIVRVHDVAAMAQALAVIRAVHWSETVL